MKWGYTKNQDLWSVTFVHNNLNLHLCSFQEFQELCFRVGRTQKISMTSITKLSLCN